MELRDPTWGPKNSGYLAGTERKGRELRAPGVTKGRAFVLAVCVSGVKTPGSGRQGIVNLSRRVNWAASAMPPSRMRSPCENDRGEIPPQGKRAIARQVPIISADRFPIGGVGLAWRAVLRIGSGTRTPRGKECTMFESLLVPLDQSKFSEHSLPTAIARPKDVSTGTFPTPRFVRSVAGLRSRHANL